MMIFENILNKEDLVFDVGANIGNKSDFFLKLGCNVVAFEPQEECYIYCKNRFSNNLNFRIENVALDEKIGTEIIYIANCNTISSMSKEFIEETKKERFVGYNWDNTRIVNTDTLDNMILKYGTPRFLKIDVEGYEINVLKGLSTSLKYISIEFSPELCNKTIECINYIDSLNKGNTVFNYVSMEDDFFKYDNWKSKEEIIEYLKSVDDFKIEFGDVYFKNINIK